MMNRCKDPSPTARDLCHIPLFGSWQDVPLQDCDQSIQFLLGRLAGNGDPERTVHDLRSKAHSCERMAAMALGTGRAGGHADAGVLQNVDNILSRDPGYRQRKNMWRLVPAVDSDTVQLGYLL